MSRSTEPKRCGATIEVTWGGDTDEIQCTKDSDHADYVWSREHPEGARCPNEHRFIIEVEQEHPHD
ncbi:MAG: hypothetical protein IJO71_09335 [Microbacterium sp.]|uniref:hypothetical protein n=1 Tax=Microbacterium sp. TaxID=51671 RepID=UPI0025F2CD47|nr:hypothetical protein [Microbacterium sp.]MBQ9917383.1 hypothetical protein [Microbacterium sp.]